MINRRIQYCYEQKPVQLLLLLCFATVLLWIGLGEYYTKGEPREASVSVSMIERNQWILPDVYAGEKAYKPPMMHWLTAIFSLPAGSVSPFTSRLPSALAFTGMIIAVFLFYSKRRGKEESFLTALILLTCFELHRAAMTSRVDMLLTALTVLALILLFSWEEQNLKGFPYLAALTMSAATLTKGPVGFIIPLTVLGIYLICLKYNILRIIIKLLPLFLLTLVLPLLWYYLAWKEGGQEFLDLVWAENFGRFLGSTDLNINYDLGHEEGWWYNFLTLAGGFLPWTLLSAVLGVIFLIKRDKTRGRNILRIGKVNLFSLIAAAFIVLFYCIPISKRSVYLMPAYPFIAFFLARFILSVKTRVAWLKHLYVGLGVYIAIWMTVDAIALPIYKNRISQKAVAKEMMSKYHLDSQPVYVMNNLRKYSNMYGLNFYFDNSFRNFETEKPQRGYILLGEASFKIVESEYGSKYRFELKETFRNKCRDGERNIGIYWFEIL